MNNKITGCGTLLNPNLNSDRCGQVDNPFGGKQLCPSCQKDQTISNLLAAKKSSSLVESINKLDIQPGNFILLRVEQRATPESIEPLVGQVQRLVPAGCTVAVLVGDSDLTTLPDAKMLEAGWVRADALEAMERLLKWYDDLHGDDCNYTGDHPLAVAKATVERIKGGN